MSSIWLSAAPELVFSLLSLAAVLGLLAIVSPSHFARVAQSGGHWVDTSRIAQLLEQPISVDEHVLRYSRLFGVAVVVSAAWLAYLFATRVW